MNEARNVVDASLRLDDGSREREVITYDLRDTTGSLVQFVSHNEHRLRNQLSQGGAILLRGCPEHGPAEFAQSVQYFIDELMTENGEHEMIDGFERVYSPVIYEPKNKLLWHNENSFNQTWPNIIAFSCARPADVGGFSILVDTREMLERLDPAVVDEFRARRITYIRTMGIGVGRHWREIFGTDDRKTVERMCREAGMDYEWHADEVLQTESRRDAIVTHYSTMRESWFNQIPHWHPDFIEPELRTELELLFGKKFFPRGCLFGDGGEIPKEMVLHIAETYESLEYVIDLKKFNVLLIDNIAMAHGRTPYSGKREIYVAMGRQLA